MMRPCNESIIMKIPPLQNVSAFDMGRMRFGGRSSSCPPALPPEEFLRRPTVSPDKEHDR